MAGPWALDRIRASGVPYAVAPFFPDDGAPFLGVQGFMINAFSENILLAQTFLTEYRCHRRNNAIDLRNWAAPLLAQAVLERTMIPT
jgi:maltose-binding protein MalE